MSLVSLVSFVGLVGLMGLMGSVTVDLAAVFWLLIRTSSGRRSLTAVSLDKDLVKSGRRLGCGLAAVSLMIFVGLTAMVWPRVSLWALLKVLPWVWLYV